MHSHGVGGWRVTSVSKRIAWIPAFLALLLAQEATALVLLDDDRYVYWAYRRDTFDPSFFEETYTPDSFFGPFSFEDQGSSFTIAADGLGFDATAIGRSGAYFDYDMGPYPWFDKSESSFEIAFRIDRVGRIDLGGTMEGYLSDPYAWLTGANGTIYAYSRDEYSPSSFGLHASLPAGEYVLQVYTGANVSGARGSFDIAVSVRDTAVPVVVPFVCDNGLDDDEDGLTDFPDDPGCESPGGATENHVPGCSNGLDDEGDTFADYPADPGCTSALDESELGTSRCDNGIDDDADGVADYPADSDCASPIEDAELTPVYAVQWEVAAGGNGHYYAFVEGVDLLTWDTARREAALLVWPPGYGRGHLVSISSAAENEFLWGLWGFGEAWIGFTDEVVEGEWRWIDDTPGVWQDPRTFPNPVQTVPYVNWTSGFGGDHAVFPTEDYGVFNAWSADFGTKQAYYVEWEPHGLACDDGVDNDGDGLVDFPEDPGCTSADDPDETDASLPCDDGIDNDGDGSIDTADPGCPFPVAAPENPLCDNGFDDDGDGAVDFDDPTCQSSWPYWEAPPACGLGAELVLLAPLLAGLRARRSGHVDRKQRSLRDTTEIGARAHADRRMDQVVAVGSTR
jgi:hypothetical protein